MAARLGAWLDARLGLRAALESWRAPIDGGPSFAHTLGFTLTLLIALQAISGTLLALFYSPSTAAAWASVAYVEDQVALGWFVRGVHRFGTSAVLIVIGLHLLVTAIRAGYRAPREISWWLGVTLLAVVIGYSVTGFVLRWDQYGYWATKVEFGYVADGPGGATALRVLQGGNELGNFTLTRMYALHVVVLPAVTLALGWAWRAQARRHGPAPAAGIARPAWPHQTVRNWLVGAVAVAALAAWTIHAGGAGLEGPADPTSAYDARPQWYLRPVFGLVNLAGSLRTVVALGVPALALGVLAALPLVDAHPGRRLRRVAALAVLALGLLGAGAAALHSYQTDADDPGLAKRRAAIAADAARARTLAKTNGVPVAGGLAVYTTPRFYRARQVWAAECASCHEGDEREAPLLEPGLAGRAHLRSVIADPSAPQHFGLVKKIMASEDAMPKSELPPEDLDAVTELVYAETGAADVIAARLPRGKEVFEETCGDCHNLTGTDAGSGPNLAGYGTRRYWEEMIRFPGAPNRFGALDDMPAFDATLAPADVRALADYLVWLRTATATDVGALAVP
jgi:ubiquinol-cytochrome c reductase cytochrome b subunit